MEFKTADLSDIQKAVKMSDRIFGTNLNGKSIGRRYPILYSAENKEHINVAKEGSEVCAVLNWRMVNFKSGSRVITAGCVGGVCTDEKARGKGCAGRLLEMAYSQMEQLNVALCFISGTRGLYLRSGARLVGEEYMAEFSAPILSDGINEASYEEIPQHIDAVVRAHNRQAVRFLRSYEETKRMTEAVVCGEKEYKMLYNDKAYILLFVNADSAVLFDYSGEEEEVARLIRHGAALYKRSVSGTVNRADKRLLELADRAEKRKYYGTVKIINPELLLIQSGFCFDSLEKTENGYIIEKDGRRIQIGEDEFYSAVFDGNNEIFANTFPLVLPDICGIDGI